MPALQRTHYNMKIPLDSSLSREGRLLFGAYPYIALPTHFEK